MKLRWKYFILLLVASLVPMTAVTLISQKASKKLGKSISAETQKALIETVRREIVFATENYAMITHRAKSSMEFALQALRREAGIVLDQPVTGMADVYFAEDFENLKTAPEDLAPSKFHMELLKDGRLLPKQISFKHPNFFLAPGVDLINARADVERLTLLAPALKGIASELDDYLLWIYVSLESGVHISYPGHGGYPEDYDPRLRPWYIRAKSEGALCWGEPVADTTTHQLTFTVSAPFLKPDGSFAGVAGIDVLIPNVLLKNEISSQWSNKMHSFLVGQYDITSKDKKQPWIISQTKMVDTSKSPAKDSRNGIDIQKGEKEFSILIEQFKEKKSGSLEMPYQGVDSIWAFAAIFPDLHFVIVAPKSMVTGLSKEVGQRFKSYTRGQAVISLAVVAVILLIVGSLAFIISRTNTKNIMSIVNGFKQLEQGDFTTRLDLQFKDERDLIVTAFNRIMPRLEEHLRMSRALGLAKDVQQSLLPKKNPVLEGFDIAGTSLYCEETGGDYYDFIPVKENKLAVVVGDVSGHGVSSSLLMATARALVMLRASMPGPAASIINDVNKQLSLDTFDTGNFMTFFYCELTGSTADIRWVRAGHDPALVYDPLRDEFDELKGHGLAFGVDYTFEYEEFQRTLAPEQMILIGTDGIWEMRNESNEMFGKGRLKQIFRSNPTATAKEMLVLIADALKKFRGSRQPEDDVTMVVIKILA